MILEPSTSLGFAHFLNQTDTIGVTVLVLLFAMSVTSWYFIVTKAWQAWTVRRRSSRFLRSFWDAPSLDAVEARLAEHHPDEPFSHLAWHGIIAARHHARHGADRLDQAGSGADFLTRAVRQVIEEETSRAESGLTLLASVGSTAPFVGLFGTVWGVYHALVAIGLSGQGTLDKVAGPVGEALIMTALGLVVAVPAVLGYNAFVRSNRVTLARLDSFAHDLFALLTTGTHVMTRNSAPAAGVESTPRPLRAATTAPGGAG
jgi:biopolymer transport protein ExbB